MKTNLHCCLDTYCNISQRADTIYIYQALRYVSVQLFQGCKSETELLTQNPSCNTLYDTKYCWRHITKQIPSVVAVVQHVCQVTLSTSLHTHQPFVYDTKYCWRHITKPIPSIVAVMQLVCQVTLSTSLHTHINRLYTILSIVAVVQHVCQVTLSTSLHTQQPFVYDTKYCWRHITKPIPSMLLSCNMFVRSHCRLHYTQINRLYTIPRIVGGILQSRYQVLLLPCNISEGISCFLHPTFPYFLWLWHLSTHSEGSSTRCIWNG
jgi:hypothetical protein